jgi:hypothetical protein
VPDQPTGDLPAFAADHGFQPSDRRLAGQTPLLRLGLVDVTLQAYEGQVHGHEALLTEFAIGSPDATAMLGGMGVNDSWFTLFLISVSAPRWPRLTVHPEHYSEGDWLSRLLHRDDHRVRGISPEFDGKYKVRVSNDVSDEQVDALFSEDFIRWCLDQPELVFDVENDVETGDSLVVAWRGAGLPRSSLEHLLGQAEHLVDEFS